MTRFVLMRLLGAVLVLLALIAAVFVLQQISPADPARTLVGERASAATLERAREQLGLDDPLPVQYANYVGDVLTGDLQTSVATRRPVVQDIEQFLPATLELVAASVVLAAVLGLLFALGSAGRWRGAVLLRGGLLVLASFPVFLLAALAVRVFAGQLGWLPASGRALDPSRQGFLVLDAIVAMSPSELGDALQHLILPAVCLALVPAVAIGRMLRSGIEEQQRRDHVRTARALGLSEGQVVRRHTIRNAAGPVLAVGGLQVAYLLGTSIVVEQIFAWPGIGFYMSQAIQRSDFPAIAGVSLVLGALYVLVNFLVDVAQAWADPRIRGV
ncbi:ABC transporter permease [Conexibacter woesei]|uniref:Binding-protein-dependent transport systems inner membrane component n=1 Tax=Conexibacter woesei (strain DSM 14684 / CCUG 47730 / CIP 108061 / JCM 11494 / NBRC 100937 / ID131577) TaxID=469383 RepID=D3F6I3_CONWI|nr:ABC transporter permease [Conexibacter woesei]ADB50750.1 binding-protein-dependent transport systems inner membrane component [Conexibacter woesei DSM 14684]